jgi:hypothetical protein
MGEETSAQRRIDPTSRATGYADGQKVKIM